MMLNNHINLMINNTVAATNHVLPNSKVSKPIVLLETAQVNVVGPNNTFIKALIQQRSELSFISE